MVAKGARLEPALAKATPGSRYQFLRLGYFFVDPVESRPGAPVFNRIIALKDTWARTAQKVEERRRRRSPRSPRPRGPRKSRGGPPRRATRQEPRAR